MEGIVLPKNLMNIKERIREHALSLFMENGYENTDMRKIAHSMEVAVGTIYNYYPSKQRLFTACMKDFEDSFLEEYQEAGLDGLAYPENIKAFVVFVFEKARSSFGIWKGYLEHFNTRDFIKENSPGNIAIPNMDMLSSKLEEMFREAGKESIGAIEVERIARIILMTVIGLLIYGGEAGNKKTLEEYVALLIND